MGINRLHSTGDARGTMFLVVGRRYSILNLNVNSRYAVDR